MIHGSRIQFLCKDPPFENYFWTAQCIIPRPPHPTGIFNFLVLFPQLYISIDIFGIIILAGDISVNSLADFFKSQKIVSSQGFLASFWIRLKLDATNELLKTKRQHELEAGNYYRFSLYIFD